MIELGSVVIGAGTGKAIGGTLQTVNAAANIALTADQNNRQLHENEKRRIKELAKGDATIEGRLLIASCALIKCSAEFVVGSAEYIKAKSFEDAGNSDAFKTERTILATQTIWMPNAPSSTQLFDYGIVDTTKDTAIRLNSQYGITP